MRCQTHCPAGGGGTEVLVAVGLAAAAVVAVVSFILAHLMVLLIGAAGVLAVVAGGVWALHRYATIVYTAVPLRAPRKVRQVEAVPSFRDLAERQQAAIPARQPVTITGMVLRSPTRALAGNPGTETGTARG